MKRLVLALAVLAVCLFSAPVVADHARNSGYYGRSAYRSSNFYGGYGGYRGGFRGSYYPRYSSYRFSTPYYGRYSGFGGYGYGYGGYGGYGYRGGYGGYGGYCPY